MSPSGLVRNAPYTVTSREGPVEEDSEEHEGTSPRRGIGTGEEQDASADRCGEDIGVELQRDSGSGIEGKERRVCSTAVREPRREGSQDYEAANAYLEADSPASRRVLFHPGASL
jgi:hypothetical protein